jgi:hypothetical protein
MYIHCKETKHTTHEKSARTSHERQHISQNFTVQYKFNEQNTETTKHENKEKLLLGIEPGP